MVKIYPNVLDFYLYKTKDCFLYKTVSQAQQSIYILISLEILSSQHA